ncbi:MAG: MBL fold metallo-hydrolase [Mesorhizobium sp.]|uniref:MBL fold metallo-hydrolase RNA specificity domain-containing protein n=1 Tax=unclassified Mesorhizobium TaxID=325217 RepID=UPI000FCB5E68|nr:MULTISPECIES: MBL fold metallo-hydrolase [unclassified Mesorhizobium]RUV67028.1 MBL fold metallo-hydrolase [Mesorhizobium sp. M5C.F.Cr.IN.023.01.1.1]RWF88694.1 MAG: MBL fold metallo-hydrolase [Mesorhizobium sp.]RWF92916.1 MAG: MBL fold metallo-hydrolase [Mesorhizobium sp.]RWI41238.1 MAG: MBL fold metallo-hydrolase [Mesorhizobium sp.]RWI49769.1 MAG: MBL fold metallo-hydrolase [Mesorhizobium sp.]
MNRPGSHSLQFLGAAGTVTGSRYLVETNGHRILVDCGLFQGYKQLRDRNRAPFPVPPESIQTVLLTHAHLDHSGYIPALVRDGFRGRVICTPATAELCSLLLPDSGHLQEEEARYARRKGYSKHADPRPLYTVEDAKASLEHFVTQDFGAELDLGRGIQARFLHAGHLLGAAQIRLDVAGTLLHFSGDLGRPQDPLMRPPEQLREADILVCESTYGNRRHPRIDAEAELAPVIRRVAGRGGVIVIPAFAVGRAQGIMLNIARLRQSGAIPALPVFLNSPMAIDATDIYHRFHDEHHVSLDECRAMYSIATLVRSVEDSKALNLRRGPMIIVSASGMLTGGRVLHHLQAFGTDPRNAILLSGFQAGGTRGAALAAGADHLRMFGRDVPVRAEVVQLESFSGHADADEILEWLRHASRTPKMTYLTHGEPDAADILRGRINREVGWRARVPEHLERIDLEQPV